MKKIPLTQGKFAIVDGADYKWLSQYKWYCIWAPTKYTYYAQTSIKIGNRWKSFLMHRMILNTPKGKQTDHKNGKGYDNRRDNIRTCTPSQNQHNQHNFQNKTSKYKGVYYKKGCRKWVAMIQLMKKQTYIGAFKTEIEAAKAYDSKAKELFRDFAYTNF